MKRVASPGSMHDTGCLGLVHWDNPEGWFGEGGGRRVQDGEHTGSSCTDHVTDHAGVTWLSFTDHVADHTLIM